jgi:hypothetical protein
LSKIKISACHCGTAREFVKSKNGHDGTEKKSKIGACRLKEWMERATCPFRAATCRLILPDLAHEFLPVPFPSAISVRQISSSTLDI